MKNPSFFDKMPVELINDQNIHDTVNLWYYKKY